MDSSARISITVSPKSSRSAITIDKSGDVKVYLNSPPVEGKANTECVKLFSKKLGIAKSRISIDRGERGRKKQLLIQGMNTEEVMDLLRA